MLTTQNKEDIIESCSYSRMCDYEYKGQDTLPSGLVHCDICSIKEFFSKIEGNKEKYVVISSSSDFGLYYQRCVPVWADYAKAVKMFVGAEIGYNTLRMAPRYVVDKCNPKHKFSIKCYSWTDSTFDHIPDNVVHWFVANNCVQEKNVSSIPFGILNAIELWNNDCNIPRDKLLYVNFQFYTNERYELFEFFKVFANEYITVERDVPYSDFVRQLFSHKMCLCPIGNGVDCYRIWECFYTGCLPILDRHMGLLFLLDYNLPVMFPPTSLHSILTIDLQKIQPKPISSNHHTLPFWKSIIDEKVNQL